jgi:hypothetical protein
MRRENIRSAFVRLCKRQGLSLENMTPALLKAFNALAEDYTFTRTTVAKPQDPVEAKAWSIAKDLADAALKKGNVARSELLPGKYEEMISNILEMKPEIMEEARTRVEEIKSLADRITL